jgi:predicted PurR-regulated permease PerM
MDRRNFGTPFFVGLLVLAVALVFFIFLPELNVVVLAITFAILFLPVNLELRKVMPRFPGIAALITVLLATLVILASLAFFGFRIFQEAQGLYVRFLSGGPAPFLALLQGKIDRFAPSLGPSINQYATGALGSLVNNLGTALSRLVGVVWVFFLALFACYYLLRDGAKLRQAIVRAVPLPEKHTNEIFEKLQSTATSVVRGSLLAAVCYGILMGLGFAVFGLPNPVLWGAVSVVAALIPVFGIFLVAIPAIGTLLLSGSVPAAIGFAVWIFLMAALMENVLRPWLIGRNGKVHPFLLLFSVLGGLAVFGATGILLGPLALSLLITLVEIYPIFALEKNGSRRPSSS